MYLITVACLSSELVFTKKVKSMRVYIAATPDLVEEVKSVTGQLTELGHLPVMSYPIELGTFTDKESIMRSLNNGDLFFMIIGQSFGSVPSEGAATYELEYELSKREKTPWHVLIQSNAEVARRVDKAPLSEIKKRRLDAFIEKVSIDNSVVRWGSVDQLLFHVRGILDLHERSISENKEVVKRVDEAPAKSTLSFPLQKTSSNTQRVLILRYKDKREILDAIKVGHVIIEQGFSQPRLHTVILTTEDTLFSSTAYIAEIQRISNIDGDFGASIEVLLRNARPITSVSVRNAVVNAREKWAGAWIARSFDIDTNLLLEEENSRVLEEEQSSPADLLTEKIQPGPESRISNNIKTVLIHRYDSEEKILSVERDGFSEVYTEVQCNEFEMVIVVPTRAAMTEVALFADATSGQNSLPMMASTGESDERLIRVNLENVRYTSWQSVRNAVTRAGGTWAAGWTVLCIDLDVSLLKENEAPDAPALISSPSLLHYSKYSREQVHSIFSPETQFTAGAGTWGIHGIVKIPNTPADYVFFVSFGRSQGDHEFKEGVSKSGVLSWQSQPRQSLKNAQIKQLISYNENKANIHLFLRPKRRGEFWYMGRLKYLSHDVAKENPVHFKWQILDWKPAKEIEEILVDDEEPLAKEIDKRLSHRRAWEWRKLLKSKRFTAGGVAALLTVLLTALAWLIPEGREFFSGEPPAFEVENQIVRSDSVVYFTATNQAANRDQVVDVFYDGFKYPKAGEPINETDNGRQRWRFNLVNIQGSPILSKDGPHEISFGFPDEQTSDAHPLLLQSKPPIVETSIVNEGGSHTIEGKAASSLQYLEEKLYVELAFIYPDGPKKVEIPVRKILDETSGLVYFEFNMTVDALPEILPSDPAFSEPFFAIRVSDQAGNSYYDIQSYAKFMAPGRSSFGSGSIADIELKGVQGDRPDSFDLSFKLFPEKKYIDELPNGESPIKLAVVATADDSTVLRWTVLPDSLRVAQSLTLVRKNNTVIATTSNTLFVDGQGGGNAEYQIEIEGRDGIYRSNTAIPAVSSQMESKVKLVSEEGFYVIMIKDLPVISLDQGVFNRVTPRMYADLSSSEALEVRVVWYRNDVELMSILKNMPQSQFFSINSDFMGPVRLPNTDYWEVHIYDAEGNFIAKREFAIKE